jgi:hypothetical protein
MLDEWVSNPSNQGLNTDSGEEVFFKDILYVEYDRCFARFLHKRISFMP